MHALWRNPRFALGDGPITEILRRAGVTDVPEGPLGEFHDVALVNQRYGAPFVRQGVIDGGVDEPPGADAADRLNL